MRVAIRRTRTIIREFGQALPGEAGEQSVAELRWVARQLGQARDADICTESLDEYAAHAPATADFESVATYIRKTRTEAYESLRGALSSERYSVLIEELRALAAKASADAARRRSGNRLVAADDHVDRATTRVFGYGNRISENSTAVELHKLRIEVKRLRYLLDFLAAQGSGNPARLAETTRELQALLGTHQDAIIVQETLVAYQESNQARGVPVQNTGSLEPFVRHLVDYSIDCRRRFPEIWARFTMLAR